MSTGAALDSLRVLSEEIAACRRCPELAEHRERTVAGDMRPGTSLMLIGEAPGAEEDRLGRPFVGRSGQLLDRLLSEAGLSRTDVSVGNVLKCRPPANRPPRTKEVRSCREYLERQIALVEPAVVVALGSVAVTWCWGPGARLTQLRGAPIPWRGRALLATYHPSAALRFGPRGQPMAALSADLLLAAELCRAASGAS